jgi:hypothetical protein
MSLRSPRVLAGLLALVLLVVGCGDEEPVGDPEPPVPQREEPAAFVSQSEVRHLIEERVPVVWQALVGEGLAEDVEPEPVDAMRLEAQNGREFVVLTFASVAAAEQAWDDVQGSELVRQGGAATRAANVVAAFPERPQEVAVYERVWQQMRRLAVACRAPGDDAELGRICFEGDDEVGPPGEGTDPDEVAPLGATVRVGGLDYSVATARQLNPDIQPDEELLPERRPGQGRVWFGVFLRVCNEGERARTPTEDLAIVGAFGQRARPVELPGRDPFGYEPERLEAGDCLPQPGSVSDRVADGALVLFEAPLELLEDRPVALEIRDGGERVRLALDV